MGVAARQEYEAKYTGESNYGRLLQIYQLAIQGGAVGPPGST
jgi:hypothetical protein